MEKMKMMTILVGLLFAVAVMETVQLNNLKGGFEQITRMQASKGISLGSVALPAGAAAADAEYEKMMDEMHPGWRETQGSGSATAPASTGSQSSGDSAIAQINNLPNMVGGC